MNIFWNNAVVKIHNDNKVIIGNTKNGKWVRTSAETLKIIEEVIDCNEDVEKIEFEELSDKEYIKRTIDDLLGIQAISAVYEQGSCCLSDCKTSGKDTTYHTSYH